jgi:hypothetical protein
MKAMREWAVPVGVLAAWAAAAAALVAQRPTERLPVLHAAEVRVVAESPPCDTCPPCEVAAKGQSPGARTRAGLR